MENEGNSANFNEIEAHIKLLGARLRATGPAAGNHESTLEDLEDYYERGIQLRVMESNTLREQVTTHVKSEEAAAKRATRAFRIASVLALMLVGICVEAGAPGAIAEAAEWVTPAAAASHIAILAAGMMLRAAGEKKQS